MSVTDGAGAAGSADDPGESSGAAAEDAMSADRLLLFTDAVVAIAITLLILPLVDLVPDVAAAHGTALDVITGHWDKIGSFLVSFAVIARLWTVHHRCFSGVKAANRALVLCNMAWLLAIVVLPFPTELVGAFPGDGFTSGLYYVNVLAGVVFQTGMVVVLKRDPGLLRDPERDLGRILTGSVVTIAVLVVALVIDLAVPALRYYSLLLLLTTPHLERLLRRREG